MIRREILGPQDRFERTGAQSLRDIRPITVKLAEALKSAFSGIVLFGAAGGMVLAPETVDLIVVGLPIGATPAILEPLALRLAALA